MPDKNLVLQIGWGDLGQIPTETDSVVSANTPEFKIKIPFGVMLNMTGVSTVNGQTGDVVLNAADVGADALGSAEAVETLLQPQIDNLSNTKLDAVDYVQHFRGLFSSLVALTTALPTALDGDYAHIDSGAGFDRMVAIWDNDDNAWLTKDVNVAANTDEMPEGATNLYFKSDRVRQTALTGLNTSVATPALATDVLIDAIGKLQAQINNIAPPTWVSAASIGTTHSSFTNVQFAKINGLLWVRGYCNNLASMGAGTTLFLLTNPSYNLDIPATFAMPSVLGEVKTFNPELASKLIQLKNVVNKANKFSLHNSTTFTSGEYNQIQPVALGRLLTP